MERIDLVVHVTLDVDDGADEWPYAVGNLLEQRVGELGASMHSWSCDYEDNENGGE